MNSTTPFPPALSTASTPRAAAIREQMRVVRHGMPHNVEDLKESVNNLRDWKYYVKNYPGIVLPIIAASTFALVPQKPQTNNHRMAVLDDDQGVRRVKLVDDSVEKKSVLGGIFGAVLAYAARSASTIAMRQVSELLAQQSRPQNSQQSHN